MKRIVLIALALFSFAAGVFATQLSQPVYAASAQNEVCNGVGAATGGSGCGSTGPTVQGVLRMVAYTLSAIAGIVAVIMLIVAGLQYVTSNGDSGKIQSAKNALTYAIVGIVVVAASQAIVRFVIGKVNTAG